MLRWFYLVQLGALGAVLPFLSARLEAAGLTGGQLGVVFAMLPLGRLLSAPVWGWLADRWQVGGLLLRIGATLSLVGGMLLFVPTPLCAASGVLLFAAGRVPLGPLIDSATLQALSAPGQDPSGYGRVRLWGSVGFLAMAWLAGGRVDAGHDPLLLGVPLMGATLLFSFAFPLRASAGPAPILPALRVLFRQPFLLPLLLMVTLHGLTLSVYDTFFSAHVQALGHPSTVTGAAVVVGVGLEIAVMRAGQPLLAWLGAPRALFLATIVGIPRWALTAWVTSPVALVAVQALHGVTFGLFWIAAVHLMAARAPRAVAASAQSLHAAASYGVGALAGAFMAGGVREHLGTTAIFWVLTGVALAATLAAGALVRAEERTGR